MRFIAVATLFLVATCAFGASDDTMDRLSQVASSKFGKTILETIQVELQTKEDSRPIIVKLLEELINETTTAQQNHDSRIANTRKTEAENQKQLRAQISFLTERINNNTAAQGEAETDLDKAEDAEKEKIKEIEEFQRQLDAAIAQRKKEQAAFEKKDAKYDKLLAVLAEVRKVITSRQNARKGASSFLEKKASSQLINALAEIKESLKTESFSQVSEGYGSMISFIATKAQNLLTPEQADANAESGLQSVVDLLDKLSNKFRNEKEEAIRVNEQRKREFERRREDLSNSISNANIELATIRREISTLKNTIANLKEQIAQDKTNRGIAETDLQASIKLLKEANEEYDKMTKQRNEELKILREVLEIVQTRLQNLRKNVEQAIINANIKA